MILAPVEVVKSTKNVVEDELLHYPYNEKKQQTKINCAASPNNLKT